MALLPHFALGLAAKWLVPNVNVFLLLLAAMIPDFLFFLFLAIGVEEVRDFAAPGAAETPGNWGGVSHGLFMTIVYSFLFGLVARLISRSRKTGVVYGSLVFSHFLIDLLSHPMRAILGPGAPTGLPIFLDANGPALQGFGLWSTTSGVLIGEFGVFAVGIGLYIWFRVHNRPLSWVKRWE